MAYLACDADGQECIFDEEPYRYVDAWECMDEKFGKSVNLPKGSIAKLIGRELTWEDEPVMLE